MVKVKLNEGGWGPYRPYRPPKDKMPPTKESAPEKFRKFYTDKFNAVPEGSTDGKGSYDLACELIQKLGQNSPKSYPWRCIKEYQERLRTKEQDMFTDSMAGKDWGVYKRDPKDDGDAMAEKMRLQLREVLNAYYGTHLFNLSDIYVSVYGFSIFGGVGYSNMTSITLKNLIQNYKGEDLRKWCREIISYWTAEDFRYTEQFTDAGKYWTGWEMKGSTNGRGIILSATYGPGFDEFVVKSEEEFQARYRKPRPDAYGYGVSGGYTGD